MEIIEVSLATPHGNLLVTTYWQNTCHSWVPTSIKETVPLLVDTFIMLEGSLTRYHTPTLRGKGFTQELVKLAGPTLLRSIGHGLQAYEKGGSAAEAVKSSGQSLKRGLKRKLPAAVGLYAKSKVKQSYKKKRQHVKDISGV